MDGQHLLPIGKREVRNRVNDLNTGIADQYIDTAIGFDYLCHCGVHLVFVGHVHGHRHGDTTGLGDFIGNGLGRILVQVRNDDFAALARVSVGNLFTNAAGGSGNDANFVLEFHTVSFG